MEDFGPFTFHEVSAEAQLKADEQSFAADNISVGSMGSLSTILGTTGEDNGLPDEQPTSPKEDSIDSAQVSTVDGVCVEPTIGDKLESSETPESHYVDKEVTAPPPPVQVVMVPAPAQPTAQVATLSNTKHRQTNGQTSDVEPSPKKRRRVSPNPADHPMVGEDSEQMKTIRRIVRHLEDEYAGSSPDMVDKIHFTVQECTKRHNCKQVKFLNLPGAIMEHLVETVGGTAFRAAYTAAKTTQEDVPSPSLVQAALAYGFYMARAGIKGPNLDTVLEKAAEQVSSFGKLERAALYQEMLRNAEL